MTTITILSESITPNQTAYAEVAGEKESVGRTAGEALDALTKQLSDDESGTLVIVQHLRPDSFFTTEQQQRLAELMSRWRAARDSNGQLPPDEQTELEALIEAETEAARIRAENAGEQGDSERMKAEG
ncbi:MAG: hypothetical protein L0229_17465 [Blastocatellia bacterium]|nr:hypothetical protein [Blastocatellia bacterium]